MPNSARETSVFTTDDFQKSTSEGTNMTSPSRGRSRIQSHMRNNSVQPAKLTGLSTQESHSKEVETDGLLP